ncbi:AMMECR1-like protein [Thelohanellus kitauei]|uniref:AMMECR1-like protein n=1 Tax=Thelohanellus kitauei TaxID=669202 RepID=A0A0C2MR74_THEKT|nr:AMMECR1-like protein [Thelohanellus kitauei]
MSRTEVDENPASEISPSLSIELTIDIPCFCFDVLARRLLNSVPVDPTHLPLDRVPLFITWRSFNRLRGCIGTFRPRAFRQELVAYALASAFDDRRFVPISFDELSGLVCCVSILGDFEPCSHRRDWQVGIHGLKIVFTISNTRYNATYLPDVASEHNWSKEQTIYSLIRKAGYKGRINQNLLNSLNVVRYKSFKVSADFTDYTRSVYYRSTFLNLDRTIYHLFWPLTIGSYQAIRILTVRPY